ncbi:hypothetical protein [Halochromatium roseum]|uniref:hypothetical protein n=1 Tax=Halochromatium roseum TaxID=391920 RepID=UPI001913855D|nr:hypothetical protein [Halochromatium roseum]
MEDGVLDELGLSERYDGGPNRALQAFFREQKLGSGLVFQQTAAQACQFNSGDILNSRILYFKHRHYHPAFGIGIGLMDDFTEAQSV